MIWELRELSFECEVHIICMLAWSAKQQRKNPGCCWAARMSFFVFFEKWLSFSDTHIYKHTHPHTHTYTNTHTHTNTHIHTYPHIYRHTHTHSYKHTYIGTLEDAYTHSHIHTHTHAHSFFFDMFLYIEAHLKAHVGNQGINTHTHTYTYIHTHTHTQTHTHRGTLEGTRGKVKEKNSSAHDAIEDSWRASTSVMAHGPCEGSHTEQKGQNMRISDVDKVALNHDCWIPSGGIMCAQKGQKWQNVHHSDVIKGRKIMTDGPCSWPWQGP